MNYRREGTKGASKNTKKKAAVDNDIEVKFDDDIEVVQDHDSQVDLDDSGCEDNNDDISSQEHTEKANNLQGDVEFEEADSSCWNHALASGMVLNQQNDENSNDKSIDYTRLTNKKKQYLQDDIIDKNGAYSYLEDPNEYKKARKRLQNRESAIRSRQRKKNYQETLEQQLEEQAKKLDKALRERD